MSLKKGDIIKILLNSYETMFFIFSQTVHAPEDLEQQAYQGNAHGSQKQQGMKGISLKSVVEERTPGYQYEKGKGNGPEKYYCRQYIPHSFYMKIVENQWDQIKSGDEDHILLHAGISKAGAFSCRRSHRYRQKSKLISQQCSQGPFSDRIF